MKKKDFPKKLRTFGNFLPEAPEKVYGAAGESFRDLRKSITEPP